MTEKFKKEISKQKWAIIIAVVLISSIWGTVLFLEYKISQNKNSLNYIQVEKDLCFYLPANCKSISSEMGYSFYCPSGSSGKLIFDDEGKNELKNSNELIQKRIKGARTNYFLEIKINEGKNKNLAKSIVCPN